jgi:hypothetical protein
MFTSCRKKPKMEKPPLGLMALPITTLSITGTIPRRTTPAMLRASRVLIQFQVLRSPASVMTR